MGSKSNNGGSSPLVWIVLICLALLVFSGRLSSCRPKTAVGRAVRDAALTAEEITLPDFEAGDAPAVVRRQLAAIKKRENEEWTERNIRRHPVLYLEHCKGLLLALREDLLDAQFGARVERTRLLRLAKEEKETILAHRHFLSEAEKIAMNGSQFPVMIDGLSYAGEAFTNAVRAADAIIARNEKNVTAHETGAERARELAEFIDETLEALSEEIDAIPLEIEALRAQEAQDAAKAAHSRIGQLLDGVRTISAPASVAPPVRVKKAETPLSDIFERNHK